MNYFIGCLKKYATFEGRATRAEYWSFTLILAAIQIVLYGLGQVFSASDSLHTLGVVFVSLYFVVALGVLLPSWAVLSRRLHDTGRSFWNVLFMLIPFVGAIILLVFTLQGSQAGANKYGN